MFAVLQNFFHEIGAFEGIVRGPIFELITIWRSFRESGKITKEEFLNTNFGFCFYRLE